MPHFALPVLLAAATLPAAVPVGQAQLQPEHVTAEEVAVYQAFLHDYAAGMPLNVHIDLRAEPQKVSAQTAQECSGALAITDTPRRSAVLDERVIAGTRAKLVDADAQTVQIDLYDPTKNIKSPEDVERAVADAFAHGLFWLTRVNFNADHTVAVLSYGFRCGTQCGNGGTVVYQLKGGAWHSAYGCGDWQAWSSTR